MAAVDDQEMKSEEEMPEPPGLKRKATESSVSSKMTLEQLMELSMRKNDEHFARLDTQLGAVKKEAEVTKSLAAKAVTIADQTNVKVNQLERRVLNLEEGGGASADPWAKARSRRTPSSSAPSTSASSHETSPWQSLADRAQAHPTSSWQSLGGPMGNTLIVGGLKSFSSKSEKEEQWTQILARLESRLKDQISETIYPGSRGQTIIIRLKSVNKSIDDDRRALLDWVKEFRKAEIRLRDPEESEDRLIYASASKPFQQRVRDAKIAAWGATMKGLLPEDKAKEVTAEMSTARIFWKRILLMQGREDASDYEFREVVVQQHFPAVTGEIFAEALKKYKEEKEEAKKRR